MPGKNKVLYISRTSILGGAEISLLALIKKLDKDIFYPIIVLPDRNGLFYDELKKLSVRILIVKMAFIRNTFNVFLMAWFLINIIFINFYFFIYLIRNNIKIIVCNSFQDLVFVSVPAKILRKKIIVYIKNILDKKWKKNIRAKFCKLFADKVIAISKKNSLDFTLYSSKKNLVQVIYDGIDAKEFRANYDNKMNVFSKYLNKDDNTFKIINIGNLSELKSQHLLLEALLVDVLKNINIRVFLIGDVHFKKDIKYKERLLNFINANKLNNKVFLLGFRKNIKDFISYSDLLVHCPTIEEGLGLVILEAFSFGKIVIGTNIGGIPEMISNGKNGFLCDVNKDDLAEKILYVYTNRNKLKFIKRNALKTVEEKFSLKVKINKTEKIYKDLIGLS